ncbi:MAG: fructose-1,6-bisphosphatase [Candidatus Diapherotrites archaeon]|nr:fructose-1,6-bisphosphatase [Candidatus Diapherotrites archaeon]
MNKITLEKHLKSADSDISKLILLLAKNSIKINKAFESQYNYTSSKNCYGEQQIALDKFADSLLIKEFEKSRLVKTVASEEQNELIEIMKAKGEFGVTLDPLDGSSCVNSNLAVGTIMGLFDEGNVMEKGSRMDAACYVIYGPLTSLVYTAKNGVHEFILNSKKEFVLKRENIKIPEGKIYSPGGLRKEFFPKHLKLIEALEEKEFKVRFSGSFAADFNQLLYYGGIFSYPAVKSAPQGKLRLLFEANPMTLIMKEAGGEGINGTENILELKPEALNQRTPLYIGNKKSIELVKKYLR